MPPETIHPTERIDAVTNLHPVRVTQEPGVVRNVTDAELLDLARSGLIHSFEHTAEAAAVLEGTRIVGDVKKWRAGDKRADVVTAPAPIGATAPITDDTKAS